MSDNTGIEWADATWNPVTGCTEVSPGCDHCYAKTFAERWRGIPGHHFERGFDVVLRPERVDQPLRWKKPRRIFVNSMSDLFHEQVPDDYIAQVFGVMARASHHTFQLLTKRHGRMRSLLHSEAFVSAVREIHMAAQPVPTPAPRWPLPNVWLGVSVENQQWADIRVRALLGTPAAVRFLSCEPLLGPVDLARSIEPNFAASGWKDFRGLHWVIVGGESGRGARPMHPEWARSLLEQCQTAGIPFLFKQWGDWGHATGDQRDGDLRLHPLDGDTRTYYLMRRMGKKAAGRLLGGRTWDEYPQAVAP
jgi:protein gp37